MENVGHWAVWLTFVVEVAIMVSVVDDRLAGTSGHTFRAARRRRVFAAGASSACRGTGPAPAHRGKAFKSLQIAKAVKLAKLHKSVRLVHRKLALTGVAKVALGALAVVLGGLTAAYMVTGRSPLKGAEQTAVLVAAGVLATLGVNHLTVRCAQPEAPDRPPAS